ncbi:hypothetical protein IFM89_002457 [Coptis chinensis]|uniref:non-specific serine/threonine protein kinase n=1 Tax=Coptis chinensis TaxID=261450 RepID=A0A835ILN3_9MAGN|nr:hypothetical protein IFM89_002457 [Coptis chinensis]
MKLFWKFIFCFLLIISAAFALNPVLSSSSNDSSAIDKSVALYQDGLLKSVTPLPHHTVPPFISALSSFIQSVPGPKIVSHLDGAVHFYGDDSGKRLWSFSTGSPTFNIFNGDNKEIAYPVDGGMVPYPIDNVIIDFGDSFMQTEDSVINKKRMMIIKEFVDRETLASENEIIVGAKKTTVSVLDAGDGALSVVFDSVGWPSDGEDSNKTKGEPEKSIYITRTDYALTSYCKISKKFLQSVSISDIRATSHHQGRDVVLPVAQIHDITFDQFLSKILDAQLHSTHISESFTNLPLNGSKEVVNKNTSPSSTSHVLRGNTDGNSTSPGMIVENKKLRLNNVWKVIVLFPLAILLVCAWGYIVKRRQSTKQLNELSGKKVVVSKKKKSRKPGNNRRSTSVEKIDENISSEEVENLERYPNSVKHGKELWSELGMPGDCGANGRMVGKLYVSNIEIAKGSNGTIVLEGMCDGRMVAVKRLVQAHHDVAYKEIQHFIASDRHPNIVRWFGVEIDSDFVYLSLERCTCSLNDLIQICSDSSVLSSFNKDQSMKSANEYNNQLNSTKEILKDVELWRANGHPSTQLLKMMREVVSGLAHLHELGIVHRDLKPQNILIVKDRSVCVKISDMGISKRLVGDSSSLGHHPTGYGSSGWQAPEQLVHGRQTRAVDLFSLGCVLFFCITGGRHPFGDHLERDMNIVKNQVDLFMVEHIPEVVDLLLQLLDPNPESRPTALNVMDHPFLWSSETRLSFLRDASDRVELKDSENDSDILSNRQKISEILKSLENVAVIALGGNWDQKMETTFIANIGQYRRYKFDSMRDLLRVVRNKLNHYGDLPKEIQELLGSVPEGFDSYFATRFPKFFIEVYKVFYEHCKEEKWFKNYLRSSSV